MTKGCLTSIIFLGIVVVSAFFGIGVLVFVVAFWLSLFGII